MADPLRVERYRHQQARDELDRQTGFPPGTRWQVGQVYNAGAIPTTVPNYFACHPVAVGGAETEGGTSSLSVDTAHTFYPLVLGPGVPVVGDKLLCAEIGGRWAASTPGTSAPACNTIRVTPHKCDGSLYVGVVITVTQGSTTIGTCTSSSGSTCDFPVADGTYTVTGVAPNGVTITGNVTVSGCVLTNTILQFIDTLTVHISKLCGSSSDTVTVTFTGSVHGTLGTCSVAVGPSVTCSITPTVNVAGETITVSFTWKGRSYSTSWVPSVSNSCTSPVISLIEQVCVQVNACDPVEPTGPPIPRPGASVTFTLVGYGVIGSGTTDSSGQCCIDSSHALIDGDVVDILASYPRYTDGTTSCTISLGACGAICDVITLSPATGYECFCCDQPIPTTLNGSDGLGSITLTYDAPGQRWIGCTNRTASTVAPNGCESGVGGLGHDVSVPMIMILSQLCGVSVGVYPCNYFGSLYPEDGHTCSDIEALFTGGITPDLSTTITCPPSFSVTRTFTTGAVGADYLAAIYGASTTVTLTVTE